MSVIQSIQVLKRGIVDLISEDDLKDKLERKGQLRVKLGADPTRPDLHLGHAVILRKMRQFQDLGHKVIMLIGDFTATIGDPSGKNKTRPPLSLETARANAQSYLEQCKLILLDDPEVLEIRWNSQWLETMGFKEVVHLMGKYTVARILERDDFSKRLASGSPISMHETLYPLAQAYDSVALEADVELGGTDQLFNLLVGRDIQREYGQEAQVVMTLPLLVGLDGVEKMSKSLDNYIGLTDPPELMYAKLMKVPDTLLNNYFTLLTDLPEPDIALILAGHPVVAHRILAALITSGLLAGRSVTLDLELLRKINHHDYNTVFADLYGPAHPEAFSILEQALSDMRELQIQVERILEFSKIFGVEGEKLEEIEGFDTELRGHIGMVESNLPQVLGADPLVQQQVLARAVEVSYAAHSPEIEHMLEEIKAELLSEIERKLRGVGSLSSFFNTALQNFQNARSRFEGVAKGGIPDDIAQVRIPALELSETGQVSVVRLAVLGGLCASNGEARRLIQNKGLKLNGETLLDAQMMVSLEGGLVLQKGKDKFVRLVAE
jgi:tyrosyl-tRNA synthetase